MKTFDRPAPQVGDEIYIQGAMYLSHGVDDYNGGLATVIDAGRTSFEAEQKMLLDKKRLYLTDLKSFPTSLVAGFLGFPKIDLSKIDIVTSDRTDEAFKTKKDKPLQLRDGQ